MVCFLFIHFIQSTFLLESIVFNYHFIVIVTMTPQVRQRLAGKLFYQWAEVSNLAYAGLGSLVIELFLCK